METTRFDGLVRGLATGSTRRRVLGLLAGAGLGGPLSLLGRQEAGARCPRLRKDKCPNGLATECCKDRVCQSQLGKCFKCANPPYVPCKAPDDQGPGFCCHNEGEHCCQCPLTDPPGTVISQCAPIATSCEDHCSPPG